MTQEPTPGVNDNVDPKPSSALEGTFLTPQKYPAMAARPTAKPLPAAAEAASRKFWMRVVLPTAIFVVLVAGIAWVSQYLPSWRQGTGRSLPAGNRPPILFVQPKPTPAEVGEHERGLKGHYDFPFESVADEPTELGLLKKSCGCADLEVRLLTAEERKAFQRPAETGPSPSAVAWTPPELTAGWQPLPLDKDKGIVVPPHSVGLVRLNWQSRFQDEDSKTLTIDLWMQPQGRSGDRHYPVLKAPVSLVPPVRFYPDKVDMGVLLTRGQATRQLWCWSATRDRFTLEAPNTPDPCLRLEIQPLTAAEGNELAGQLGKRGLSTRVRSGYRVTVTLSEEKDGAQLEMGYFQRALPFTVKLDGQTVEGDAPVIYGQVRSDVRVLGHEAGKIDLGRFRSADGTTLKVHLVTEPRVELKHAKHVPPTLQVPQPIRKSTNESETVWELEIAVPPRLQVGVLPPDSALFLQLLGPGRATPRVVRIPVLGTATSD